MARKNKGNHLRTLHRYDLGSFLNNVANGKGLVKTPLSSGASGLLGAAGQAVGQVGGSLIGGGLSSGAGSVISGLSGVASAIPGPWGAVASAGLGLVGGLVNRAFGSKINQENVNQIETANRSMNNFTSDVGSFDDLEGAAMSAPVSASFRQKDVGKDGWFSDKAKNKYRKLRDERNQALAFVQSSIDNNLANIQSNQMQDLASNFAAFGGPLDFSYTPIDGAIDYELAQRRLAQKELEDKKAFGGSLNTQGGNWTNGVTFIDSGGTHEENPFEGVPMGIAPDGQPNLVEEGEVIFNDYVFSNRLRVPKAVREKYKLRGVKNMTFADAAKKAQKESEERPNDPIAQRGLEDIMNKLMVEQESIREQEQNKEYAEGGSIHIKPSKRGTFTAAASKHNMGVQEFASKVLANPDNYSTAMVKKANFARNASKWKHAHGGLLGRHFDGPGDLPNYLYRPDYTIGWDTLPQTAHEELQETPAPWLAYPLRPESGTKTTTQTGNNSKVKRGKYNPLTALRYVPALGAGIGVFSDLMGWTNKPDYSHSNLILDAADSVGDVNYTPIGDYLAYTPLDRLFYANQLGAQAGATRRNIMNTSGGNRGAAMAGLLAADYNAQEQLGKLYRQAEEYNLGQRERVATFNRATNMFKTESDLKAQIANRENSRFKVNAAERAAALRDAADARASAARSANLTNLFDSLGNIGREAVMESWINNNPGLRYNISLGGRGVTYGAKGGLLTIKNRRRR
jgi:hypothetical protein